jgi:hypothetical protein
VIQESVVGNLEEPRAELPFILIASRREIGLDQRVLCQIVGFVLIATAEGEQKASKCLLLALNMGYENFACHFLSEE